MKHSLFAKTMTKKIKKLSTISSALAVLAICAGQSNSAMANTIACTQTSDVCVPQSAYERLGYGINYLDSVENLVGKVINLTKTTPVRTQNNIEAVTHSISGSSFEEFSDQLARSAGLKMSYGGFKASVKANYNASENSTTSRNFSSRTKIFTSSRYYMQKNKFLLRAFLTDQFAEDLKRMTPEQIINAYGTHVVLSALLGAKFELRTTSAANTMMKKECFDAHVEAEYNGLVGSGSVTADTSSCSSSNKSTSNIEGNTVLKGGDQRLQAVISSQATPTEIKSWSA